MPQLFSVLRYQMSSCEAFYATFFCFSRRFFFAYMLCCVARADIDFLLLVARLFHAWLSAYMFVCKTPVMRERDCSPPRCGRDVTFVSFVLPLFFSAL